jgi:hypothetical protein
MGCAPCAAARGKCSNNIIQLRNFRKLVTTLYNTAKTVELREEYMAVITEIDSLIAVAPGICPTQEKINLLNTYIKSEYAERIR